ncbi:hypothetical protein ACWEKT_01915 [Nocardia takedensis]
MGVLIEAARIEREGADSPVAEGIIERATRAGRRCLTDHPDHRVRLLIDIGVYRDSNIVEPAVAALIQKNLGLGLRYTPGVEPVLSFDLLNGPCGFLSAVETAGALLAVGDGHCLVVAGDGHPAKDRARPFPYAQIGAAALLSHHPGPLGFGPVYTGSGSGRPSPHGYVDLSTMGRTGRETISFAPDLADQDELVKIAVAVARECLESEDAAPQSLGLVVNQPFAGFAKRVAEELAIARVFATPAGPGADPHTAAPLAAYRLAAGDPGADLLFLAAGAGPTAAASRYRRATAPSPQSTELR